MCDQNGPLQSEGEGEGEGESEGEGGGEHTDRKWYLI